ncbi:MAG TPA: 3-isopropylmalate dehydratase small subunit, partial [Thermoleophilia bacterium]|nr:3-isopropylmalate dehydratase small subunit [Thermoleophilia bacterium]
NCTKIGLLPVVLAGADVRELIEQAPAAATIDLAAQLVTLPSGRAVPFSIDAGIRERLLNGWDDISLTEQRLAEIEAYEHERERSGPNVLAI